MILINIKTTFKFILKTLWPWEGVFLYLFKTGCNVFVLVSFILLITVCGHKKNMGLKPGVFQFIFILVTEKGAFSAMPLFLQPPPASHKSKHFPKHTFPGVKLTVNPNLKINWLKKTDLFYF